MKKNTSDALRILARLSTGDACHAEALAREIEGRRIAAALHRLRTRAGLTQAELARRIGSTQSTIARLEDADYAGHSLPLLRRIAAALGHRLDIRFVPRRRSKSPAKATASRAA